MMKKKVFWRPGYSILAWMALAIVIPSILRADDRYAVLIGVDQYASESGLQQLEYAATDVERLSEVLVQRGYQSSNVIALTSKKDERYHPTRENIHRILSELGEKSQMTSDDSVMIVFSGHGFNSNGESYLCPANFRADSPVTSSIRVADVAATLAILPVGAKFMVLDACREEIARGDQKEFNLNPSLKSMRLNEQNKPQGIMFFSSCLPGQISYEDSELQGGAFMAHFVKGLEGAADFAGNHDKIVSAFELSAYASSMTSDYVRKSKGRNQRPWADSHTTSDLTICEVPDHVYEEKRQDWGMITRMSPLEVQAREQASELVYEALLRFAGGSNDESINKLSNAIEIDNKFFLARQFRALLYMVKGNNLTRGKSSGELSSIYPIIADNYKLAVDDMKAVGGELRIPIPDYLDSIELKRGTDVVTKAVKGDFILVRNVQSDQGHHWLEVSAIQRASSRQNSKVKPERFDPKQPVFAYLPLLARDEANDALIRKTTGGTEFRPNNSQGSINRQPLVDAPRVERAARAYDLGAGIANQFGAGLPTGFSGLFRW